MNKSFIPQLIASVEGVTVQQIDLESPRTTLGRKKNNNIVLDSIVVSGEHCVFDRHDAGEVTIEDLKSTNGTYINGRPITPQQLLHNNDLISIGNFNLLFVHKVPAAKPASEPAAPSSMTMSLASLGFPGTSASLSAGIEFLAGLSKGLKVPVVKAVTTFGHASGSVVAISHRRDGYYVAHATGKTLPLLNGQALGEDAKMLAHGDVLNLAGEEMRFFLKGQ
ncbi:hypothetical protein AwPolaro_04040 [Polaromonas sp.]|nr:hypothetical protein AwPolaro_04040 [Polaromonas sp.]